jgi:EmrB/QacA subfamily drug resistance transporter
MLSPHRSSTRVTFAVLAAASAAFTVLQSLVNPVLPTIQRELHTTPGTVTWVLTAYLLSASVATPLLGRVGDTAGKSRTLLLALGALGAGSLIAALAPSVGVLIGARVLQGLGGAIFPLAFGIVRDEFPPERVAGAIGGLSGVIAAGGGVGIVLAGPIVDLLGWRWLFWIPLIVVSAAGLAAHRFLPESPRTGTGRLNWLAAALLSGWLVALLIGLSEVASHGWGATPVLGLFAVAIVVAAAWIAVELRSAEPLIDMRMMRLPGVWTTNVVALLFGAGMFSILVFLPQFLQAPRSAGYGFGVSITGSGLLLVPMLVAMTAGGSLSGSIARTVDAKAQLALGSLLSALACGALTGYHEHAWAVSAAGGVLGLGMGLAYASMTNLVVHSVPVHQTGVASGMNANIRNIGGAIGTAIVASLITSGLRPGRLPAEAGFTHGFALLTACSIVAVAIALLVPGARRGRVLRRISPATVEVH